MKIILIVFLIFFVLPISYGITNDSYLLLNDSYIFLDPTTSNLSKIEINFKNNESDTVSFINDLISPILAIVGVIIGAFLTYFVGFLKERPINSRTRRLVYTELTAYKKFIEEIKEKDIDKTDVTHINIEQKDIDELEIKLTDFLISYFDKTNTEKRLQIFQTESLYKLEIAYRNFSEFKELIRKKISLKDPIIRIEKAQANHTLNVVDEALKSMK